MKRQEIRKLKRAVALERDADAMLTLLKRSVQFGHKKLALTRCIQAERLGISVEQEILTYCQDVANGLPPEVLLRILKPEQASSV
jgi:hypothetical protein